MKKLTGKTSKINSRRNFINNLIYAGVGFSSISTFKFHTRGKKQNSADNRLPVINHVDICVLGGSCTGVFAAVRASRLGARVALVEKQNSFGGVATNSMVNVWHSLRDTEFKNQIIAGMTLETIERLSRRHAVIKSERSSSVGVTFNSQELKIELDEIVSEANIIPYLHTLFSEPWFDDEGNLSGVIIDNKTGRGIIKAKFFIDATGDGDLCYRLGIDSYSSGLLQPPTTCAYFDGWDNIEFNSILKQHGKEFNIPDGFFWGADLPGTGSYMLAGTRVYGVDCADAADLTKAEIEGRRQIRAISDMIRKYGKNMKIGLAGLPSQIGIRETRHIKCLYQITDDDALYGKKFPDAIANGSYRLDIHHQDKPGLTFRYLDGTEVYSRPGYPDEKKRWRNVTSTNPTFYQVPLRSIIPKGFDNLMIAGRMIDASIIAFSGIRVMVNMNQLGEAAGVTTYLALNHRIPIKKVDPQAVRSVLAKGGSLII